MLVVGQFDDPSDAPPVERAIAESYARSLFSNWSISHYLYLMGVLDEPLWDGVLRDISRSVDAGGSFGRLIRWTWKRNREVYNARFTALIDSLVGGPLPDDGFVDVPGGRVAFRVMGEDDGIPVPECVASPRKFSVELYEYMWGPSEFVSTGTLRDYSRIDRLPELDIPTLFLVGEYDEARPETMREFQALVPGSIVKVIPDAGHLVNVDRPQAFNDAISEFLTSVEGR